MAEYIKREDAIDLFWTVDTENNGDDGYTVVIKFGRCYDSNEIEALLSKLPAADVAEVRHGRWIVHFDHFAPYQKCSVCGFEIPLVATENEVEMCFYKHCPECTARMDKEAEHETS